MQTIGCDFVQGYYFHRALPASEVPAVLAERALEANPFADALPATA